MCDCKRVKEGFHWSETVGMIKRFREEFLEETTRCETHCMLCFGPSTRQCCNSIERSVAHESVSLLARKAHDQGSVCRNQGQVIPEEC